MSDATLTLTADERETLIRLLEETLKATQVEEHRTRAPSARQVVLKQEDVITSLLRKLGKPPA
jgi:hypothetical protein